MNSWVHVAILVAVVCCPALAGADESPKSYRETFSCVPQKLTPVEDSKQPGLSLDLGKAKKDISAASSRREYDFADGKVRVSFVLRYLPADEKNGAKRPPRIELAKTFFKKSGEGWALMMAFASPTVFDLPVPPDTVYVLKSDATGDVPAYDVECSLKREKVKRDCADCRPSS